MPVYRKGKVEKSEPLERMRAMLEQRESQVEGFFVWTWREQGRVLKYWELREMVLTGELDAATLEQWRQMYSKLVTDSLYPLWEELMALAAKEAGVQLDLRLPEISRYTADHAAELVTNCTAQQREAIRAMVRRAATLQDVTVDELAYMVRPTIGLYKAQAVANLNYYKAIRDNLIEQHPRMKPETVIKRARSAASIYAGKQHRYRALMIARTELAFAYNTGGYYGVRQAQAKGLMGNTVKQWVTADDERVCPQCKALDGAQVAMEEQFPGAGLCPPLHPHCRCAVNYIEI